MIALQTITPQSSATPIPRERQNVAIKVLRRKYATAGLQEVALHRRLSPNRRGARYIVRLLDALFHDGHICQVYELHGVVAGPLSEESDDSCERLVRYVRDRSFRERYPCAGALMQYAVYLCDRSPEQRFGCAHPKDELLSDDARNV